MRLETASQRGLYVRAPTPARVARIVPFASSSMQRTGQRVGSSDICSCWAAPFLNETPGNLVRLGVRDLVVWAVTVAEIIV